MNLPDTFPKRLELNLGIDLKRYFDASYSNRGYILDVECQRLKIIAEEKLRDLNLRRMVFNYCGSDPGEGFKTDLRIVLATDEDGSIYLIRPDLLPIGDLPLRATLGLLDGTYEEYEDEDGEMLIREVRKNRCLR
jgi:hypothetical protein